jgi:flagellar hook assembly protein FlgD
MNVCETWEAQAGIQSFKITEGLGKRGESENLPLRFNLYQNYPNPFNSVTTIKFDLPKSGHVKMVIYNILGQKVITAIDDDMPAGRHAIIWNSENESGDEVASGIYLYKIETDDHRDTKKLVLLK